MILNREPAMIAGAIRALVLCAVAFGLQWTAEQIGALMLAVEAVLTVFVRQSVTPNVDVRARVRRDGGHTDATTIFVMILISLAVCLTVVVLFGERLIR